LVLPPVTNDFISLLKDSSLVSVITMVELTKVYTQISATTFDYFGTGLIVAALYLLLGLPFVRFARWIERKLDVDHIRSAGSIGRTEVRSSPRRNDSPDRGPRTPDAALCRETAQRRLYE
jgi:hypothetical protein